MTSRRTALNAYERTKRGLANGGFTVLGNRRDPQRRGPPADGREGVRRLEVQAAR